MYIPIQYGQFLSCTEPFFVGRYWSSTNPHSVVTFTTIGMPPIIDSAETPLDKASLAAALTSFAESSPMAALKVCLFITSATIAAFKLLTVAQRSHLMSAMHIQDGWLATYVNTQTKGWRSILFFDATSTSSDDASEAWHANTYAVMLSRAST